ncbi:MAG: FAD-dependent oxidoreductase [Candidatus Ornithospirochaeta sp.]|nr:FAD-dependent oxidoreductase [Candidatus Ornithospirochaeta sp.]
MKVIVLGGVAAGTKAAAKLRRESCESEIVLYTKSRDVSYAGCGLPYYISGEVEDRSSLIVNTPESFEKLTGVKVRTGMEAVAVDTASRTVSFADGETDSYDKLVIATGAEPIVPDVNGTDKQGVFTLRSVDDAVAIRSYIEKEDIKRAIVVGAGLIGLETAEAMKKRGIEVTVVDMASELLPSLFDSDMSRFIRKKLQSEGIRLALGSRLEEISGDASATGIRTDRGAFDGRLVVLAIGIRPATGFLASSGIEMDNGYIVVDSMMRTSADGVYAAGDAVVVRSAITGKKRLSAMGSTANITGRILSKGMFHDDCSYRGCLGTAVARILPGFSIGRTGLTEREALSEGFDAVSVSIVVNDKPAYFPGSGNVAIRLVADRSTGRMLGVQAAGEGAVDKIVDTAAAGISMKACLSDYDSMDLAYAPPFSTAINPLVQACYVLENKISGVLESFTPEEYYAGKAKDYEVVDVNSSPTIPGARFVSSDSLEKAFEGEDRDKKLLLVCARGRKSYLVQNRLKAMGFTNTRSLEGGVFLNDVRVSFKGEIPPAEVRRVKALGCLKDKRYPDVFNVRIITRNGKITAAEQRTIAEAAEKFGSGEVTMTTRLTLEIQGVRFDNIQPLIDYLNARGLTTGGTGSLVRPVVSCKGTTCQYGLIDTFGLSEKLHEKFYVGYHGVTLPHKFKIAVGGCPNNCVKPNLNDLGIVGQSVPSFDISKCRGCKVCQVVASCPIRIAKVENGVLKVNPDECNNCSRCKGRCPFKVTEEYTQGYKVYIGGRWGKKIAHGIPLERIFRSEEEVIDVVEKSILLFRDEGKTGERFADTVARLGFDYVNDKLLNSSLDKEAVLGKQVKGGATC